MKAFLVAALLFLPTPSFAQVDEFPFTRAIIVNSPPETTSWPITSGITSVRFSSNGWVTDFDKRLGANAWPNIIFPPEFADPLQYTLGLCRRMTPSWMCSFVVEFWQRRIEEEGPHSAAPPNEIAQAWFYDSRWGGLAGWQPQPGEQVGVVIMACDGRNRSAMPTGCVPQRTNARLVTWGADIGAPVIVPPPVEPPPTPPTQPPVVVPPTVPDDVTSLRAQIERIYADIARRDDARSAQIAAAQADLAARIDNPGWFKQVFSNRYVQLALATATTYFTTHQMTKP